MLELEADKKKMLALSHGLAYSSTGIYIHVEVGVWKGVPKMQDAA